MSNIAGKAYGMTVVTPMKPLTSWINTLIYQVVRGAPSTLQRLLGLSIIHFARWAMIRRNQWPNIGNGPEHLANDYLLFCSNFNGTWDQYIDAFSAGVASGLDLVWFGNLKFPGAMPVSPFKAYICANQIMCDFYYNATPGVAQRDVKSALRVADAIRTLTKAHADAAGDHVAFATAFATALRSVQNDLGSHGCAPIASTDAYTADRNRRAYLAATLCKPGGPHPPEA